MIEIEKELGKVIVKHGVGISPEFSAYLSGQLRTITEFERLLDLKPYIPAGASVDEARRIRAAVRLERVAGRETMRSFLRGAGGPVGSAVTELAFIVIEIGLDILEFVNPETINPERYKRGETCGKGLGEVGGIWTDQTFTEIYELVDWYARRVFEIAEIPRPAFTPAVVVNYINDLFPLYISRLEFALDELTKAFAKSAFGPGNRRKTRYGVRARIYASRIK